MFRILFIFDALNDNLYLFHNDSFNNFCFKSATFIFRIVIPVYVSDISFIYLFHIIAVLCESILLCIYSLYSTYLRNCKMMFVLFFSSMTYLFVICLLNLALAALPLPL